MLFALPPPLVPPCKRAAAVCSLPTLLTPCRLPRVAEPAKPSTKRQGKQPEANSSGAGADSSGAKTSGFNSTGRKASWGSAPKAEGSGTSTPPTDGGKMKGPELIAMIGANMPTLLANIKATENRMEEAAKDRKRSLSMMEALFKHQTGQSPPRE